MFCSKLDCLGDCLQCPTGATNCSTGMGMSKCVWEPLDSHLHHRKWKNSFYEDTVRQTESRMMRQWGLVQVCARWYTHTHAAAGLT